MPRLRRRGHVIQHPVAITRADADRARRCIAAGIEPRPLFWREHLIVRTRPELRWKAWVVEAVERYLSQRQMTEALEEFRRARQEAGYATSQA